MMIRTPLLLAFALVLAACSGKAQNETSEAASAIAADVNATAAKGVSDTSAALAAASNGAGDAAADTREAAGDASNAADATGDRVDNAM